MGRRGGGRERRPAAYKARGGFIWALMTGCVATRLLPVRVTPSCAVTSRETAQKVKSRGPGHSARARVFVPPNYLRGTMDRPGAVR